MTGVQTCALPIFLGSFATAFFLYGVAWIYGSTGTTNLAEIRRILLDPQSGQNMTVSRPAAHLGPATSVDETLVFKAADLVVTQLDRTQLKTTVGSVPLEADRDRVKFVEDAARHLELRCKQTVGSSGLSYAEYTIVQFDVKLP